MFDTLLETKAAAPRRAGGAAVSVVVHAALIAAAVVATGQAAPRSPRPSEVIILLPVAPPDPAQPQAAGRGSTGGRQSQGPDALRPPEVILDGIPEIDIAKMPSPASTTIAGGQFALTDGVGGAEQPEGGPGDRYEWQVEKPAIAAPDNPAPRYPEILKAAGVEGRVLVQFVVDTTGRAELATLRVLASSHDLFTSAVRASLPAMRFLPAETGGRKVRMWVQVPYEFAIGR